MIETKQELRAALMIDIDTDPDIMHAANECMIAEMASDMLAMESLADAADDFSDAAKRAWNKLAEFAKNIWQKITHWVQGAVRSLQIKMAQAQKEAAFKRADRAKKELKRQTTDKDVLRFELDPGELQFWDGTYKRTFDAMDKEFDISNVTEMRDEEVRKHLAKMEKAALDADLTTSNDDRAKKVSFTKNVTMDLAFDIAKKSVAGALAIMRAVDTESKKAWIDCNEVAKRKRKPRCSVSLIRTLINKATSYEFKFARKGFSASMKILSKLTRGSRDPDWNADED